MAVAGSLTRADLSEAIYNEIGLSRAECSDLVEAILSHMSDALAKGDNVKISGFGSFVLRVRRESCLRCEPGRAAGRRAASCAAGPEC